MLDKKKLFSMWVEITSTIPGPSGWIDAYIKAILEAQQPSLVGRRARHKQPCINRDCCFKEFEPITEIEENRATCGNGIWTRIDFLEFEDEPQSRFKVGDPVVFTGHKSVYMVEQVRGEWVSFSPEGYPYAAFYHQDSLTLVCDHSFKCEKCGVAK